MKILFVCSALEPGHDGVGDYSRRLAAALIVQGHDAGLLAINDKHVSTIINGEQKSDGISILVLRLPSDFSKTDLVKQAKRWVDEFNPDILSLQFVPFAFHPKGLKTGLSKTLLTIAGGRPWHIMFHELWVGMAREEPKKLFWWGRLQRVLISSLIRNLQPHVVHTQAGLYLAYLQQMGINTRLLPLFGNIPVIAQNASYNPNEISIVVFGLIHSGAPVADFAREAADYSIKHSVTIKLIFVGRCGPEQQRWVTEWHNCGLPSEILGAQSAEDISKVLSEATFGVSATATAVIAKSGAAAAMLEHGLPVFSVSKPWTPRNMDQLPVPDGVIIYQKGDFESCMSHASGKAVGVNVAAVANQFIEDISKHAK